MTLAKAPISPRVTAPLLGTRHRRWTRPSSRTIALHLGKLAARRGDGRLHGNIWQMSWRPAAPTEIAPEMVTSRGTDSTLRHRVHAIGTAASLRKAHCPPATRSRVGPPGKSTLFLACDVTPLVPVLVPPPAASVSSPTVLGRHTSSTKRRTLTPIPAHITDRQSLPPPASEHRRFVPR